MWHCVQPEERAPAYLLPWETPLSKPPSYWDPTLEFSQKVYQGAMSPMCLAHPGRMTGWLSSLASLIQDSLWLQMLSVEEIICYLQQAMASGRTGHLRGSIFGLLESSRIASLQSCEHERLSHYLQIQCRPPKCYPQTALLAAKSSPSPKISS